MIKIALDIMGGDNAPHSNIDGAIDFLNENNSSVKLYLVGDKNNACGSLACGGGVSGKCHKKTGAWSGRSVQCELIPPIIDGLMISSSGFLAQLL